MLAVVGACTPATSEPPEPDPGSTTAVPTTEPSATTLDPDPDSSIGTSTTTPATTTLDPDSTSDTTGPPIDPSVTVELITDQNRHHAEMHGGWGPHLRAPMLDDRGTPWFAYDGGPSVLDNTTIHYARRDASGWQTVASQPHTPGVQQNAAHVLRNGFIMTYAVDVAGHFLEECYFDTTDPTYAACNAIQIGGPYATPPSSNYVGAALGPAGETITWFTVVGAAGGTGQWIYTYDYGGGWNGPVVSVLPGWNDYAYVRASFRGPSEVSLLGQAYVGAYPMGEYAAGVDELSLGSPATFDTLTPPPPAGQVRSSADLWVDPRTGDTHALAHLAGTLTYHYLPAGAAWSDYSDPVATLDDLGNARFLHDGGGPLVLVGSGPAGLEARWASAGSVIDWSTASSLPVAIPAAGFEAPSAIYVMRPEYQTAPVSGLHFAVCGQYAVADEQIWYGRLEL
ncbi:hypothetical protein [Paraliomyxa miuraensis]|uniref:hypothetical protein n=1 Tax=Paraliomyxa miuraensis TaxID=376150 RepID=UPI002259FE8C|nr:hypothetical protein [Paraliomyxa miuraensis]MCX4240014.1 hypothetical protein [Paraliomyxa miuraensis]